MGYGRQETDVALNQKRRGLKERLARETRIGWPTLTAIPVLVTVGALIVAYLFLNTGAGR
jgi:hypothetical protein